MEDDEVSYGIAVGDDQVNAIKKAAGVDKVPAIVVFKDFDEGEATYDGDVSDKEAISKFVAGNSLPLIVKFSQESAQKIFGGNIKQHALMFVDDSNKDETKKVKDNASPVAQDHKGEYLFVTIDKSDERILEFFGITETDIPTIRIVELGEAGMKKFKPANAADNKDLSTDYLKNFVAEHKDGKLTPDLKSEEVPEKQEGPVMKVVGKNYNEITQKSGKNVLVSFTAPWCGHCKKMKPIYKELAEKYADQENLIIADVDGTANEVEEVQVSGFPTLFFYNAKGEKTDYTGGRDLESFEKFLAEQIDDFEVKEA